MDNNASNPSRQGIAQQAETAIANQQWSRLRFIGNRFERARCYRDCWLALTQASEATTHHPFPIRPGPDVSCGGVLVLPTTRLFKRLKSEPDRPHAGVLERTKDELSDHIGGSRHPSAGDRGKALLLSDKAFFL